MPYSLGTISVFLSLLIAGCANFPSASDYIKCPLNASQLQVITGTITPLNLPSAGLKQFQSISTNKSIFDASEKPSYYCNDIKTFDALLLSGGGADGAYGNGVLVRLIEDGHLGGKAWSTDPINDNDAATIHPCVVTGISAGAVLAPYAYLASSEDDRLRNKYLPLLKEKLFQSFEDKFLFRKRSMLELIWSPSQYDVTGLKSYIGEQIKNGVIKDVAIEYARTNRKLLVGATNLRNGDIEVIDLSDFAAANSENKNTCFSEVIRASAAIPVVFDPVAIEDTASNEKSVDKLYIDGGARRMLFLDAKLFEKLGSANSKKRVFGIINNTFKLKYAEGKQSILGLAEASARIAADELYRDVSALTTYYNKDQKQQTFWISAKNVDAKSCIPANPKSLFDHQYQTCLYSKGFEAASDKSPWSSTP